MQTVTVLLPIPVDRAYSYAVPESMVLTPGDLVQVPIGPRLVAAAVWDGSAGTVNPDKLKQVEKKFDCPGLDETMRRFVDWLANYYVMPAGMVLKMVLRVPEALDPPGFVPGLRYCGGEPERLTPARRLVLELAREGGAWTKSGLAHAAGVSASVVSGLSDLGIFEPVEIPLPKLTGDPDPDHSVPDLNEIQEEAAARLRTSVNNGVFGATLIDGITGSGKTEVYFEAISAALKAGKQVLILLPEISLTTSFLDRFEQRFGTRPAEWHSDISPRKREQCWRQVATGQIRVVAGARSALFLPLPDLGLIVVDEEHDPAYKQEDRVFYNARDMAVVRGHLGDFPVILSSATPSIESQVNAEQGRYDLVRLPERFAGAELPELKIVDMRRNAPPAGRFISNVLVDAVKSTMEKGQQSMLFLNRRGYAPLTLCRVCGHRFECNECSAWLVEHRFRRQLQCHHCGYSEGVPEACPNCGTLDHLVACGPGVERLGEEVNAIFPDARTIVLSSDMAGGVKRLRLELDAVAKGEADIVIGTQLVAKGHNFPLMTCVGVIDADLGLANGDPRAAERTFQLLSQVTGRAGRAGQASTGYLQSYQPEHPVIQAIRSGDREKFYSQEIEARRLAKLPPFGRLASLIVSANNRPDAENHARSLRRAAPAGNQISVLGPAEAPLALIRGRYRFRILLHGDRKADIQKFIRQMIRNAGKERGSVRVQIDVDPQSFL